MAFGGRLFAGTLPSGRVHAMKAGTVASYDRELAPGWRHLAAVRDQGSLRLFIDGQLEAEAPLEPGYEIANHQPLRIGFGGHDYFSGKMRDVRFYEGSLTSREVSELSKE